jgi:hypothetical protein
LKISKGLDWTGANEITKHPKRKKYGASKINHQCDERQQKHTHTHTPSGDIMR